MKEPLIVLTGPTAVGKTKLSISLARAIGGEIVSADSMQVYRHLDIGSAKITPQEMQGIPHHLIDVLEPEEPFDVVHFQQMAKDAMKSIYSRGRIPILTGGTGFYIQAVTKDIDFTENEEDSSYRRQMEKLAEEKGTQYLHQLLAQVDPASAAEIHANNKKRVIRALEFYHETGTPISVHNQQERRKESPYNLAYFVLNDERNCLYQRIDQRVDQMLSAGLLDEVKALRKRGCTRDLLSMQGLGYKELLAYLDGEYPLEEAIRIIKRDTRHFAKRQITWFKREKEVIWLDKPQFSYQEEKILQAILEICKEKGIIHGNTI